MGWAALLDPEPRPAPNWISRSGKDQRSTPRCGTRSTRRRDHFRVGSSSLILHSRPGGVRPSCLTSSHARFHRGAHESSERRLSAQLGLGSGRSHSPGKRPQLLGTSAGAGVTAGAGGTASPAFGLGSTVLGGAAGGVVSPGAGGAGAGAGAGVVLGATASGAGAMSTGSVAA